MAKIPQIETTDDLLHLTGLELRVLGSNMTVKQLRLTDRSRPNLIGRAARWYAAWKPAMQELAAAIDRALAQEPKDANQLYWALRLELSGNSQASRLMGGDSPLPQILNPPFRAGDYQEFRKRLELLREIGGGEK